MRISMAFLLAPLFTAGIGLAAVFTVLPGQSIQDAVNTATDGDTVLIEEGIYDQATVLYGKSLCIGSQYLMDHDTSHIAATIISPNGSRPDTGSCFVYAYGEGVASRLVGLYFLNGTGTYSDFSLQRNGGAVFLQGSNLSIERCRFTECRAYAGGGICVSEDHAGVQSNCWVNDCVIEQCVASESGGGITVIHGHVEVRRTDFIADTCLNRIGGAGIDAMAISSVIDSCRFIGNIGGEGGLAITLGNNVLSNCSFLNNGGIWDPQFPYFALTDLWICCSNTVVRGCLFDGNATDHTSMLLSEDNGSRLDFVSNVVRNYHIFDQNIGELVAIQNVRNGEFAYNVFSDDTVIRCVLNSANRNRRIHHNAFLNDHAEVDGSAFFVQRSQNDHLVLDSNVFVGNTPAAVTSAYDVSNTRHPVHAENNWWGDPSGPYHPTLNPTGQGDTLLQDSIYFIPWLTEPPDTTMPNVVRDREHVPIPRTWELLDVYPNPFNSSIRIVLAGFGGKDFSITLHNLLGEQVDVIHRGALTGGEVSYQAPANLASGVYFVRATDHLSVQSKKVILLK